MALKKTLRHTNTKKRRLEKKMKGGVISVISRANTFMECIMNIKREAIDSGIEYELCGHIETTRLVNGIEHVALVHTPATRPTRSRPSCDYETQNPIIWHSHPMTSKFYPSIEDILKVVKTKKHRVNVNKSYIITSAGLWQLFGDDREKLTEAQFQEYIPILDKIFRELYFSSGKGRVYNDPAMAIAVRRLNLVFNPVFIPSPDIELDIIDDMINDPRIDYNRTILYSLFTEWDYLALDDLDSL